MSDVEHRDAALMIRLRSGITMAEAGREFRISRERVRQIAARNGYTRAEVEGPLRASLRASAAKRLGRGVKATPAHECAKIWRLRRAGKTVLQIAEEVGRPYSTVARIAALADFFT
jgi:hypothetical protein